MKPCGKQDNLRVEGASPDRKRRLFELYGALLQLVLNPNQQSLLLDHVQLVNFTQRSRHIALFGLMGHEDDRYGPDFMPVRLNH